MRREVLMPRMGQSMEEGVVLRWLKRKGEQVARGEHIAEIETDKASVEMESFYSGTVVEIIAAEGDTIQVGQPIAVIEDGRQAETRQTTDPQSSRRSDSRGSDPSVPPSATKRSVDRAQSDNTRSVRSGSKIVASPVARRLATENGLDLSPITGTGPGGRIGREDVEKALAATDRSIGRESRSSSGAADRMRQTIAAQVSKSKSTIPHFYLAMDVDLSEVITRRNALNSAGKRVSINDIILMSVARVVPRYPALNGGRKTADISLAIAVDGGVISPVLNGCERCDLDQISERVRVLVKNTRAGKLAAENTGEGSVTVSNLGMFEVREFYPIIDPSQSAIFGVGGVRDEVREVEPGKFATRKMMTLTLCVDHRVADGKEAAEMLREVKRYLETAEMFS